MCSCQPQLPQPQLPRTSPCALPATHRPAGRLAEGHWTSAAGQRTHQAHSPAPGYPARDQVQRRRASAAWQYHRWRLRCLALARPPCSAETATAAPSHHHHCCAGGRCGAGWLLRRTVHPSPQYEILDLLVGRRRRRKNKSVPPVQLAVFLRNPAPKSGLLSADHIGWIMATSVLGLRGCRSAGLKLFDLSSICRGQASGCLVSCADHQLPSVCARFRVPSDSLLEAASCHTPVITAAADKGELARLWTLHISREAQFGPAYVSGAGAAPAWHRTSGTSGRRPGGRPAAAPAAAVAAAAGAAGP